MKIKPEHVAHMRAAIAEATIRLGVDRLQAHRAALHTLPGIDAEKRYRWDVARAAGLIQFLCDEVYSYAHDAHIDTALRRIIGN